jgi:hypothetical protein
MDHYKNRGLIKLGKLKNLLIIHDSSLKVLVFNKSLEELTIVGLNLMVAVLGACFEYRDFDEEP